MAGTAPGSTRSSAVRCSRHRGPRTGVRRIPRRLARSRRGRCDPVGPQPCSRSRPAGWHDPRHEPVRSVPGTDGGAQNIQKTLGRLGIDAVIAIGGEGTAAPRSDCSVKDPHRRCAEDDRQRPQPHRLHLRFRHGRRDRDGGDRPSPHHRQLPQAVHGARGHGPARRMDRIARGYCRWCTRHPHPRTPREPRTDLRVGDQRPRPRAFADGCRR